MKEINADILAVCQDVRTSALEHMMGMPLMSALREQLQSAEQNLAIDMSHETEMLLMIMFNYDPNTMVNFLQFSALRRELWRTSETFSS